MTRSEALERYQRAARAGHGRRALALHRPARLRPGRVHRGAGQGLAARVDARARRRRARARGRGRDRDRARAGGRHLRAALARTTRGCTSSSAGTRSSPRTTRRCGSTACSCASRRASCSSSRSTCASRTRSRTARSSGACSSRSRRARRFTLIEEYASARPDLRGYSNAVAELFVGQNAKLEYVSIQNLSSETWHFATHHARVDRDAELDWVAGGFGSKKGKVRIQNDLAGPGATSRVTGAYFADGEQHLDYDTFQEHIAPRTDERLRLQGRAARPGDDGVARDDPRRERGAEDERVPGEPEPDAVAEGARRLDPGPGDPRERRPLHPRLDDGPGRPRAALLPDGPRPLAAGGGADHRARLLPGHPGPHRPRARPRSAGRGARVAHPAGASSPDARES